MLNKDVNNDGLLVFSLAFNGYQWLYRKNLESHQKYCDDRGYCYQRVTRSGVTSLGKESVWLKIALIQEALNVGHQWVVCLDADTQVRDCTPNIESLREEGKSLYLANGYSGRFNSGVIIVRNCPDVRQFFNTLLLSACSVIPEIDQVGWGENGHLIHLAHGKPFIKTIDSRWNNNSDVELDDYIRHYSQGPLHDLYKPSLLDYSLYIVHHKLTTAVRSTWWLFDRQEDFYKKLWALLDQSLKTYPVFSTMRRLRDSAITKSDVLVRNDELFSDESTSKKKRAIKEHLTARNQLKRFYNSIRARMGVSL